MTSPNEATAFLVARIGVDFPGLSIDVAITGARSETIGLVGANGSGKTTVLRAIAGLQPLHRGSISINAVVVDDANDDRLVPPQHRRVGMVFQDYRLFPNLTALENVAFGLRCRAVSRKEAVRRATEFLDRVGLADQGEKRPASLSGGQSQRVALARALATEPDVLLLDEPLAAIDADSRDRIADDLGRHLAGFAGVTVIVSHQHSDIRVLADHAVVVEAGKVAWVGLGCDLP